jgi:hypothetical protein
LRRWRLQVGAWRPGLARDRQAGCAPQDKLFLAEVGEDKDAGVIDVLKAAFVQGRLTKDEFPSRSRNLQALLAALTAVIVRDGRVLQGEAVPARLTVT